MPGKREQIEPHPGDKRWSRRDARGQFTAAQDDVGQMAGAEAPTGRGDRGNLRS
jgi:hypothetical protein